MNFLECADHKGWQNTTSYFWWNKNVGEDKVGFRLGEPETKKNVAERATGDDCSWIHYK